MMIRTKHFELFFEEDDAAYGSKISTMIEDIYSRITTTFQISDLEETYRFVLCRDIMEYLQTNKKDLRGGQSYTHAV